MPLAAVSSLLAVGPFVLGRTSSEFGAAPTVPIPEVALGVLYWFAPFVFALGPVLAARLAVRRPWGTPPTKVRPRGFVTALLAVLAAGGVLVGLGARLYLAMLGGGGGRLFGFFVANAFNGAIAMVHLTRVIVLPIAASALAVRAGWATRLLVMALVAAAGFGVHQVLVFTKNEGIRAASAAPIAEFRRLDADTVGPLGRDDLMVSPVSIRQEADGTVTHVEYQVALRGTATWVGVTVDDSGSVRCTGQTGAELDVVMAGDRPRSVCRTVGEFNVSMAPADWGSLDIPFELVQLARDLGPMTTGQLADLAERG